MIFDVQKISSSMLYEAVLSMTLLQLLIPLVASLCWTMHSLVD